MLVMLFHGPVPHAMIERCLRFQTAIFPSRITRLEALRVKDWNGR